MSGGITTGTRIGPYEIVGWLGAGGMGEVVGEEVPAAKIAALCEMHQRAGAIMDVNRRDPRP